MKTVVVVVVVALIAVLLAMVQHWHSAGDVNDDQLHVAVTTQPENSVDFMMSNGKMPSPEKCMAIVKNMIGESYNAYRRDAWGYDELRPLSRRGLNWYKDTMGVTIVDSLDVLLLVGGFDAEVKEAISYIDKELDFEKVTDRISFFEISIRVLGGLLSSYHLSGEPALLRQAVKLGDLMMEGALVGGRKTPRPFPFLGTSTYKKIAQPIYDYFNTSPDSVVVFASVQLEFRALSYFSNDPKYDKAARKWMRKAMKKCDPLCALAYIDGEPDFDPKYMSYAGLNKGDSFYEYILKQYVMTNRSETRFLKLWNHVSKTLSQSHPNLDTYLPNFQYSFGEWHHLSCFFSGSMALSSHLQNRPRDLETAKKIMGTCSKLFQTRSGLPKEKMVVLGSSEEERGYRLRPEVMESLFYLYRFTRDEKYREQAWDILKSIYKHLRLDTGGFASTSDVDEVPTPLSDRMDSFWISETLKYAYLLFAPDSALDFGKTVLTTEAHFLPIFNRTS